MEPETLIPMALKENPEAQLVMAGDIKQLGPAVHWTTLGECGYSKSLFERLYGVPGFYRENQEWSEENPDKWPTVYCLSDCWACRACRAGYNEYIVYDPVQIQVQYLFKMKFKY